MLSLVKRRQKPVTINRRQADFFVQTVYYKDNPRAVWNMLLILLMVAVAFVSVLFMTTIWAVCLIVALFALPLYAAISGRTWFSFNASHDKPLLFEPHALQVGDEYFTLQDLAQVRFYIHSFYGFRVIARRRRNPVNQLGGNAYSEYGDKNELQFHAHGKVYTCRFLLGSGKAWFAMYEIIKAWQQQGVAIDLQEEYSYDFVYTEIMKQASY